MAWSKIASVYCTDALATVKKLRTNRVGAKVLLGADSAFYGHGPVGATIRAGAQVSARFGSIRS